MILLNTPFFSTDTCLFYLSKFSSPLLPSNSLYALFSSATFLTLASFIHTYLIYSVYIIPPSILHSTLYSSLPVQYFTDPPLPELSGATKAMLLESTCSRKVWLQLIEETKNYYLKFYPQIESNPTGTYKAIGMKMLSAYPCIKREGMFPWVSSVVFSVSSYWFIYM